MPARRVYLPAVREEGVHDAAIYRNGLAHHVVACARCEINSHARHILVIANAACWYVLTHDIPQISCGLVHFRGKRPGRDTGDKNAVFDQSGCKPLGQTDDRSFRGLVAVGFPWIDTNAIDRCNIDSIITFFSENEGLNVSTAPEVLFPTSPVTVKILL